jgi:hypothetical protein
MIALIQRNQAKGAVEERLLPKDEDVLEVFGIGCSIRRGYATHDTNVGISDMDIKRLVRWRAIEAAVGKSASLPGGTKEHYSEINQMIRTILRASHPL